MLRSAFSGSASACRHSLGVATVLLAATSGVLADVPAFSGADGAGSAVTGGRGGVVYHVTKLDSKLGDNGPGTLQYGVNNSNFTVNGVIQPRTIVFDVGGTIWLGRLINDTEGWDTTNVLNIGTNVTIAGQTAPGGITIAGGQVKVNGTGGTAPIANDVVRNLTLAPGYGTRHANSTSGYYDQYTYDAMDVNSSGVMIDHLSAVFGTDETISSNEFVNKTTIQYTSMSQGQSYPEQDAEGTGVQFKGHALGSLWSPGSNAQTTFSHNLYAHESGRAPTLQTEESKLTKDSSGNYIPSYTDVRNNVIYNWLGSAGYGSNNEPAAGNIVNNYYKVGPGGDTGTGTSDFSIVQSAGGTSPFTGSGSTTIYASGNLRYNLNGTVTSLGAGSFASGAAQQTAAYGVPYFGVTDTGTVTYSQVLNYVGANWQNRSAIDARIINEVKTGTGKITALDNPTNGYNSAGVYTTNTADTEWNKLLANRSVTNGGTGATGSTFTRAANYDTDADGMPDVWEAAMGTNPAVADNNGAVTNDGYTNLEEYINEVGAWPASTTLVFGNANGTQRYAEIGNWQTGVYKPSRYDSVQVNAGSSVVDVPGQHAGVLAIGGTAGGSGALSVNGGWIDVSQSLYVGPAGTGAVNQSAGLVHATRGVVLGGASSTGSYTLSGGTLATPLLSKTGLGGSFTFTGGTLHADRVAFTLLNNGGTIAPGSDISIQQIALAAMPDINGTVYQPTSLIGNSRVNGDLNLAAGTLEIQLAADNAFDTITIDNALTLGGQLAVQPIAGYTPIIGTSYLIGTAGSITGSFASITPGYVAVVSGGNLYLTTVPEPMSLASIASVGLLLYRRSRRN